MKKRFSWLGAVIAMAILPNVTRAGAGADVPWTTYEAEDMKTTGTVLGPKYEPFMVETESSGEKCVRLTAAGQFVEFTTSAPANAMVIRYCLPDSADGRGVDSTINLFVNGKLARNIPVTSHYSWIYGKYPFTNKPQDGRPRNFFNEARLKDLALAKGDVVRLEKSDLTAEYCIIDLVDLEKVAPPLRKPARAISVLDFGAGGKGETDDTEALKQAVATAHAKKQTVWLPPGDYKITGDIVVPSDVTLQGAGMWHTVLAGDENLYNQANHRVRLKLNGLNIRLADFAILGKVNYRNDDEPNDGVIGAGCSNSVVSRVWVEHTKVGMWFYNCHNLRIEGCRMRNVLADGLNLCVGTSGFVVENCSTRGTGDDCFAMWPTVADQGYVEQGPTPGNNVFRHCTGQLPFLANGAAIYGGKDNRIEDCLFQDISVGCGILVSTTFPTADEKKKRDNNFSGKTVVRGCEIVRCGGFDHGWSWRGALQICLDRRTITNLEIRDTTIRDSISDGLNIVAPGTLTNARLVNVNIPNCGLGAPDRHGLWVREDARGGLRLNNCVIVNQQNDSLNFKLIQE